MGIRFKGKREGCSVDRSFSESGFLRKVFEAEDGDHKLVVIAVHAVMLESGFVGFDARANAVVDGLQLRLGLSYTLPECVVASGEAIKHVVLKFQSLGNYLNVHGTLVNGSAKGGRCLFRVRLNEDELIPLLNLVRANSGVMENVGGEGGVEVLGDREGQVGAAVVD
ncbi:putative F-box protein At1g23770 [Salvia hispanica]|uniref:putative F-box protein At1g23770 n=1 Tax=Salvia hispanica TaxID=49212 RepID=UPI002009B8ED|nr:putative F-box protein At1g23770 [Salvia hispanica]XP_047974915.1 putative F-box protein At1g23770 [Salvia hispanica]XP_047974916.1 putative F-box protein At1g23770 [Salvia hispanica]XP_047974917.1 putative F-box protein At1g23770 [Salvia hispanica]